MANRVFPWTNFLEYKYKVHEHRGPRSSVEELVEEDEEEEVVVISDNDDDDGDDNDIGSRGDSSNLESCVTDIEVDPWDKIQAWVAYVGENAFAGIRLSRQILPGPPGGPLIT